MSLCSKAILLMMEGDLRSVEIFTLGNHTRRYLTYRKKSAPCAKYVPTHLAYRCDWDASLAPNELCCVSSTV